MNSTYTVYTLFITVNIVSQSQQMRAKKKIIKNKKRELKNTDTESQHTPKVKRNFHTLDFFHFFIIF